MSRRMRLLASRPTPVLQCVMTQKTRTSMLESAKKHPPSCKSPGSKNHLYFMFNNFLNTHTSHIHPPSFTQLKIPLMIKFSTAQFHDQMSSFHILTCLSVLQHGLSKHNTPSDQYTAISSDIILQFCHRNKLTSVFFYSIKLCQTFDAVSLTTCAIIIIYILLCCYQFIYFLNISNHIL